MRSWLSIGALLTAPLADAARQPQTVLLEVPVMLEAPGHSSMVRAWHDGADFYVDASALLRQLGYVITRSESHLTAQDAQHSYVVACASLGAPECMVRPEVLAQAMGNQLFFDQERLHIHAASRAVDLKRTRTGGDSEIPLQFGRTRALWGGLMAHWELQNHSHARAARVRLTSSALYGTLRVTLDHAPSLTYAFDLPRSRWLTSAEIGRIAPLQSWVRLSNRLLARRTVQRMATVTGAAAAHAFVEARLGQTVVDHAYADASGVYQLNIPARYGTSEVTIHERPLGGRPPSVSRYHWLTLSALEPPGRLHYDITLARSIHGAATSVEARYGLRPRLTVHVEHTRTPTRTANTTGLLASLGALAAVNARLKWPESVATLGVRLWRPWIDVDLQLDTRTNGRMHASFSAGPVGGLLSASRYAASAQHTYTSLHPSLWVHAGHRWSFRTAVHSHAGSGQKRGQSWAWDWRLSVARHFARARWSLQTGNRQVGGLNAFASFGRWSIGFTAAWDRYAHTFVHATYIGINSSAARMIAQSRRGQRGFWHSQTVGGTLALGAGRVLFPSDYRHSAVLVRVYHDANGNGRRDPHERLLPQVQVQIHQAAFRREPDGAIYAAHLEPFGTYQVRILEASVRDPSLVPASGWEFAFLAEPGRTKVLNVAMQRLPHVAGQITGLDRPPSRLQVTGQGFESVPVYRDGGFELRLRPGAHTLSVQDVLTGKTLAEHTVTVRSGSSVVRIDLAAQQP